MAQVRTQQLLSLSSKIRAAGTGSWPVLGTQLQTFIPNFTLIRAVI